MNTIRLTWDEIEQAAYVGIRRQSDCTRRGLADAHGWAPDPALAYGTHVVAAITEMAVAKYLHRFWSGSQIGTFKGDDVEGGIQVRYSRKPDGRLLVRESDPAEATMVHVVIGPPGLFTLAGWKIAGDCKRPEWAYAGNGRPPCYLVPQSELLPVEDLLCLIH